MALSESLRKQIGQPVLIVKIANIPRDACAHGILPLAIAPKLKRLRQFGVVLGSYRSQVIPNCHIVGRKRPGSPFLMFRRLLWFRGV